MSDEIRRILDADWKAVAELENLTYAAAGLSEDRAVLEARGRSAPETCFVLTQHGRTAAYVLALPWPAFRFPDLARHEQITSWSANLHLHDLVVAPDLRGRGLAGKLLRHLTTVARDRDHDRVSLVAVGTSASFWAANGFRPCAAVTVPTGYGTNAVYMSKPI
ncbi:hypothetical protein UK23_06215 [Lentzea aerocolonigenes]|uniref:N-acetyltransferase domain-containing protein n=1 Tax=Lentzea aerocolonigenes TaxID=68170 RepID=A0A0F0H867_LENAE|nr:GNAT family N-acetyltransferase [Lentzea aerocolonigenes]KJK51700.1 hypothetical protein UK23_06215 [Lentzea aerocolonigenes]